jgi:1,4-dihydroxy-2-naphthoate octaprenyltransferase
MSPRFRLSVRHADPALVEPIPGEELAAPDDEVATSGQAETPEAPEAAEAGPLESSAPDSTDFPDDSPVPEKENPSDKITVADGVALMAAYRRAVLSWLAQDGYPMNVEVEIEVKTSEGTIRFSEPPGFRLAPGMQVAITGSYLRLLPNGGFEDRSHVTLWGLASARPRGRFAVSPTRVWASGEIDEPPAVAYERRVPQARRYFDSLSADRGIPIGPTLSTGLAVSRLLRTPFARAAFAPVLLGLAVAVKTGRIDFVWAAASVAALAAAYLGVSLAAGLLDLLHVRGGGRRPGEKPGGLDVAGTAVSRASALTGAALGWLIVAAALAVVVLVTRGSPELIVIIVLGLVLGLAEAVSPGPSARGLGEVAAALGFGPLLLLGTYAVQSRGFLPAEAIALSIPLGLIAGLIAFLRTVPNRPGDARAGRRTLATMVSESVAIRGFEWVAALAFISVVAGVVAGVLPIPALAALLAAPSARRIRGDLSLEYDRPSALAAVVGWGFRLQRNFGLLLIGGYALTIADQMVLARAPFLQ